jgi:hypothetical protein
MDRIDGILWIDTITPFDRVPLPFEIVDFDWSAYPNPIEFATIAISDCFSHLYLAIKE